MKCQECIHRWTITTVNLRAPNKKYFYCNFLCEDGPFFDTKINLTEWESLIFSTPGSTWIRRFDRRGPWLHRLDDCE